MGKTWSNSKLRNKWSRSVARGKADRGMFCNSICTLYSRHVVYIIGSMYSRQLNGTILHVIYNNTESVHCRQEGCIGKYIPEDREISQGQGFCALIFPLVHSLGSKDCIG